jgi:hypothetical protein
MHVFLNAHIYFLLYILSFFLILWQALTIFALFFWRCVKKIIQPVAKIEKLPSLATIKKNSL